MLRISSFCYYVLCFITLLTLAVINCHGRVTLEIDSKTKAEFVTLRHVTDVNEIDSLAERELVNIKDHQQNLRYQFNAHGKDFDLRLAKNGRIKPAKISQLYVEEDGKLVTKSLGSNDDFALYQDKDSNAAVAVTKENTLKKVEGFVMEKDAFYELRPVEDDKYMILRHQIDDTVAERAEAMDDAVPLSVRELKLDRAKRSSAADSKLLHSLLEVLEKVNAKRTEKEVELRSNKAFTEGHIDAAIELLICTDDTIWDYFMKRNNQDASAAEAELRKYYSLIANGIDLRYQNIDDPDLNIYIVLSAIIIVKTPEGARWFSGNVLPGAPTKDGRVVVDKTKASDDWCKYRKDNYDDLPEHDHGMAFTMRELASNAFDTAVAGVAPVAGICSRSSSCSIVESHGGFTSFITAAHELGHNLGASHDGSGTNTACPASNGNIMAPTSGGSDPSSGYYFSDCSIAEFKKTLRGACCLVDEGRYENSAEYAANTQRRPGQLFDANQQCQMQHGGGSSTCNVFGADNFCQYLRCKTGAFTCSHKFKPPADGTDCAEGKWCIEGRCVDKKSTPAQSSGRSTEKDTTWCPYGWPGDLCKDSDAAKINVGLGMETCESAINRDGKTLCKNDQIRSSGWCCIQCYYYEQSQKAGIWSDWGAWSGCSASCGSGTRKRSRICPVALSCAGDGTQTEGCSAKSCGTWTEWKPWTTCTVTCGGGSQTRSRTCDGGSDCPGSDSESRACNSDSCPGITPKWGEWGGWSDCSKTCGGGTYSRTRSCDGGATCDGTNQESSPCNTNACPGTWSEWGPWTTCSATCGGGTKLRTRTCKNGVCDEGVADESEPCNTASCPAGSVDGNWSDWSAWSACSVQCGKGEKSRDKLCNNPAPSNGGSWCCYNGMCQFNKLTNKESCDAGPCEKLGTWGQWGEWTECSATCGGGSKSRTRTCVGGDCDEGVASESEPCNTENCPAAKVDGNWGDWSAWSDCSVQCGKGERSRVKSCDSPAPSNGGSWCCYNGICQYNKLTSKASCDAGPCIDEKVDGNWGSWTPWSTCSFFCQKKRAKYCNSPVPSGGGKYCTYNGSCCYNKVDQQSSCSDGACIFGR